MWFETQNCAMMGVQPLATCGKRKLEADTETAPGAAAAAASETPCKAARWDAVSPVTPPATAGDDCLARLRAVAAVPDCGDGPWRHHTPRDHELPDDDDDWDDELSDYDEPLTPVASQPPSSRQQQQQQYHPGYWHQQYYQYQQQQQPLHRPQPQQTIRREENGKSYLELGPASAAPPAPAATVGAGCYRQRRLAVLNMSMCKLARYRQCSDPSLRRSVLICNTLRHIEREMEREGRTEREREQQWYHHHQHQQQAAGDSSPADYGLRDLATPSGRVTPFPHQPATPATAAHSPAADSGYADTEPHERSPINWGSVLSLTAHAGLAGSDHEPLNNNLGLVYGAVDAEPDIDTRHHHLHHQPDTWDSFVHVLVSGT